MADTQQTLAAPDDMQIVPEASTDALAGKLQAAFGDAFVPAQVAVMRDALVKMVAAALPGLEPARIADAFDVATKAFSLPIDWSRLLDAWLRLLPGYWTKLTNSPGFGASTMLLLTDGSVMCQEQGGKRWKRLRPDAQGSYLKGAWSDLAPMHWTRRYYASAVLADGRVFVSGGEYSDAGSETNKTEIYDPVFDKWTEVAAPAGWPRVGDAACAVLPDGRLLLGNLDDTRTAIFDPATDTFSAGPTKPASSSEESWVLLPDETVITVRCDASAKADKYVAAANTWVDGGTLPTGIVEIASSEIGAGVLMNDGRAFFAGANGHTALYTPPALASAPGTWAMAPDFPLDAKGQRLGCKDAPACLLPNGKVLIAAGPVDGARNDFLSPTSFFEFDGAALARVPDPPTANDVPFIGRMLLLPTGQVLFAAQTGDIYAYSSYGTDASARPQITAAPAVVRPLLAHTLHGRLLNGLSQAVGYGDDAAAATNYPIARIRHRATGVVTYCRTFDHSTMGVGTGASVQSTAFQLPWGTPTGTSDLVVVANGVASAPVALNVRPFVFVWPFDAVAAMVGGLAGEPLWVLGPNGPVPVDPSDADLARRAQDARGKVLEGIGALRAIGAEIVTARDQAAAGQPLAPDDPHTPVST
jgi:hypothetical protein